MDHPVEKFTEDILGSRARYLESGQGRPIILISGWLGTAENFLPLMEFLSNDYRCLALDLPGLGKSTPFPNLPHTVENYSKFLEAFSQKLSLKNPVFVGVSLGGSLLLYLSAFSQNPPSKIIVQSPIYKPIQIDLKGQIQLWILKNIKPLTLLLIRLCRFQTFHKIIYFFGDKNVRSIDYQSLNSYGPNSICFYDFRALVESINDILQVNLQNEEIKKIPSSVLLVYGSEENLFNREYEESLAQAIPNCTFRIIPGGSHFLMLQKPKIFANLIGSFLEERD